MPRMDYDLRQILSTKEVGCLKYFYRNCSTNRAKFDRGFSNVKYILKETLKALAFIHSSGYVHRDVKGYLYLCDSIYVYVAMPIKVEIT